MPDMWESLGMLKAKQLSLNFFELEEAERAIGRAVSKHNKSALPADKTKKKSSSPKGVTNSSMSGKAAIVSEENGMDSQSEHKMTSTAAMETEDQGLHSPSKLDDSGSKEERELVSGEGRIKHTFSGIKKMLPQTQDNLLSSTIEVHTLPWRILVTCRASDGKKYLGVFLQCNAESTSTTWTCFAAAELRLHSTKPKGDLVKSVQHVFHAKENDWGFAHFIEWPELTSPERGFLVNDTVTISVHLVAEPPHGVNWDSKKLTGWVGLKNQGATCYMNSLLQAMFFTNKLRWAVYQMPTDEKDELTRSIPLALQKVFYELQFGDKAVGTKKLTKSFGWETLDSFMQHDVQELSRVLLDNLENKMKGTRVEGSIPQLFEGKMESFVRCKFVDYESTRIESFYDIQLNVKNKKNIYESFDDYVAVESLDGDNKYDAGQHGLQEASKGIVFVKFPPILSLHLMRFQYDAEADANIKINDRFEFPEELDLMQYVKKQPPPDKKATEYMLLAVFVHSGDNHGGHYVVYVNPQAEGQWYKFDDDVVCRATRREAIDMNFGGGSSEYLGLPLKHNTSAYMLVYVLRSAIADVLKPVTREMLPPSLVERMEAERAAEMKRKREREEAHLYVTLRFMTIDQLRAHHGLELMDVDRALQSNQLILVRALKTSTFREVAANVASSIGASGPDKVRFWFFFERPNQTLRPMLVDRNHLDAPFADIFSSSDANLVLYAEVIPGPSSPSSKTPPPSLSPRAGEDGAYGPTPKSPTQSPAASPPPMAPTPDGTLVFVKLYDPRGSHLSIVGHVLVKPEWSLLQMAPSFAKLAGLPVDTRFYYFEEVSPGNVNELKSDVPISQTISDLMVGDIIVIQPADIVLPPPSPPVQPGAQNGSAPVEYFPTAAAYLKDLANRIEVQFSDKTNPADSGFIITLHLRNTYAQVSQSVGHQISCDPERLLFYRPTSTGQPQTLRPGVYPTLRDMVPRPRLGRGQPARLFYQRLNMKLADFENKRIFKCLWTDTKMRNEDRPLTLHVDKTCRVADVLAEARRSVELPADARLRMVEIVSNRIIHLFGEEQPIEPLNNTAGQSQFRIEEVPHDELTITLPISSSATDRLVPVAHFQNDPFSTFGLPFLIRIHAGEPWSDVARHIQRRLDLSDRDFDKYKMAVVHQGRIVAFPEISSQASSPTAQPWVPLSGGSPAPMQADEQHATAETDQHVKSASPPPLSPQNPTSGHSPAAGGGQTFLLPAPPPPNVTVTPASPVVPVTQQQQQQQQPPLLTTVDVAMFSVPSACVTMPRTGTVAPTPVTTVGGGLAFHNLAWIGLDHQNKTPKRARYMSLEKAIKIHN